MNAVCRCCLKYKTFVLNLFDENHCEKLKLCTNISVEKDDGFPDVICDNCFYELNISYLFVQKCKTSDTILKEFVEKLIENELKNENEQDVEKKEKINEVSVDEEYLDSNFEILEYDDEDLCSNADERKIIIDNCEELNKTNFNEIKNNKEVPIINTEINKVIDDSSICYQSSEYLSDLDERDSDKTEFQNIEEVFKIENNEHVNDDSQKRSYSCNYCDNKFKIRNSLHRHIKRTHPDKAHEVFMNSYYCSVCDKTLKYKYPSDVELHQLTHSDIKPYKCEECNKSFQHMRLLAKHLRNKRYNKKLKENPTKKYSYAKRAKMKYENRNVVCEYCGKIYNIMSYRTHIKVHTTAEEDKFTCEYCNKKIVRKSDFIVHKRIHTEEKPYICEVCNKRFISWIRLHEHKKIHNRTERFPCICCNKTFASLKILKRHRINMTKPPKSKTNE